MAKATKETRKKSKSKPVKKTAELEPGVMKATDTGGLILRFSKPSGIYMLPSDDSELLDEVALKPKTAIGAPPDGRAEGAVPVRVTDQNGNPVKGVRVSFAISHVRPGGNWRSRSGMVRLYNDSNGDGAKAGRLVGNGTIRLLGTLSGRSAVTGDDGVATVNYRTSHIASDYGQRQMAQEKITATLPNGASTDFVINVGWTGLSAAPTVTGGLRIVSARGRHVHPDVGRWLGNLGKAVRDAKWPQPVTLTAASLRWGGQYPPHFTHKHGASLDLRPMSTDGQPTEAHANGQHASNYDFERTKILIGALKQSGATVYFNGRGAGGTPKSGHHNHIHATWLRGGVLVAGKGKQKVQIS